MSLTKLLVAATAATTLATAAVAETGVTADTVTFGQVAAFEGPAGALGTGMRQGILAAFAEANANGGVHGRTLELVTENDGYEPDLSAKNVQAMIDGGQVFGLIGPVGTPTTKATQPIATAAKVPFIGPFTGAGFLRDPALGNIANVRATYAAETEAWIRHLVDEQGMKRIAIVYQDDAFGRVGLDGVNAALKSRGMELVAEATYERNTTAVKGAVIEMRKAKPEAIVMVGAYKPLAEFIKLAKKMKIDAVYMNISFVGSKALAEELGADAENVMISQVVPFPWDTSLPIVAEYQTALKAQDANASPGFVSLEGYLTGRLAIEALQAAGPDVTRQSFMDAIWAMSDLDMGGLHFRYAAGDSQGLDDVFLTRIQADGSFVQVGSPKS